MIVPLSWVLFCRSTEGQKHPSYLDTSLSVILTYQMINYLSLLDI